MKHELQALVRDVHDTIPWLCFCALSLEDRVYSETQLSVMLHLDLKQIRSALQQLWKDNLVSRVNASGLWRLDVERCRLTVIDRLKKMERAEKMLNDQEKGGSDADLYCPTCQKSHEIDAEVMDAMQRGEEPRCSVCNHLLGDRPKLDSMLRHITSRICAFQVTTTNASSSAKSG